MPPEDSEPALDSLVAWLRALGRRYTYSWRNPYAWFGVLWGLPVPIVTTWVHLRARGLGLSHAHVFLSSGSLPLVLALHPMLFAAVFGAFGTLARDRTRRIRELLVELGEQARRDALTGLLNRRAFDQALASAGLGWGLILADVDHFKAFNDRHGHPQGDQLLAALARRLQQLVRGGDTAYRFGGEEFAVLVPGIDDEVLGTMAHRLLNGVSSIPLRLSGDAEARVTISLGAARLRPDERPADWLSRADSLLYQAKRGGRNRACTESSQESTP